MALGKGLSSLIPPKSTRIKVNSSADPSSDISFTTRTINSDEGEVVQDIPGVESDIITGSFDGALEIDIDRIRNNSRQPRKEFNESKIAELSDSIKNYGIIEPLVLSNEGGGEYELIAGERRLRAARLAGLKKVPAIIRSVDDQEKLEIALIENIQREDLNPIETASAYRELMGNFGLSADKVGERVGKSRSKVANTLRLLSLPSEIQSALASGEINEGHAIYLLGLDSPIKQMDVFRKITMNNWTVAETGKQVKKLGGTKNSQVKINLGDDDRQKKLEDYFGTKVEIKRVRKGGKVVIDFYSDEELESIIKRIK